MIGQNVRKILNELPGHVELEAAAKTRTADEIQQAIAAGVKIIGENYLQEAEKVLRELGNSAKKVKWHFIGHLQKNKINRAVRLFDLLETVDSEKLAVEIDASCVRQKKIMPVLVQINSGREEQKFGVMPEEAEGLVRKLGALENITVKGLMTMGPAVGDPELTRPFFARTKQIFDRLHSLQLEGVEMQYLSMGMTNSYLVAIAEGANIVRIGSKIFGDR